MNKFTKLTSKKAFIKRKLDSNEYTVPSTIDEEKLNTINNAEEAKNLNYVSIDINPANESIDKFPSLNEIKRERFLTI